LANKIKVEDVYLLRFDSYHYSALEYIPAFSDFDVSGNLRFEYLFDDVGIVDYSPISNWDTSSATSMEYMFSNSSFDDTTVLSAWDVSSAEDMEGMFRANQNIVNLNGLVNWDTSSVTDMSRMFESASSLASIDGVTNWDVSDVESMEAMFAGTDITSLNALTTGTRSGKSYVSWDTSDVTNMSGMFNGADYLINIDGISNWDISSVTDMSEMFSGAMNITWLQSLNGWGVLSTIDMDDMFYNIPCTVVRPVWYVFADGCSSSGGSGGTVTIGYALELYYTEVLHKGMYVANNDGTGAYHEMQPNEQLPSGVDTRFALQDFTASVCSSVTVLDDVYGALDLANWGIVNITKSSSDGLCHRLDTGAVIP
jgi:surface protein